jgi:hypothetical protein
MAMTTITELDARSVASSRKHLRSKAPSSFDEIWPAVEAELDQAEAAFRRLGPQLSGFVSQLPEHVHQRYQATIGAVMVANRKALIDCERTRVKAATEGGMSATDKQRRLDQLRAAVLRAAAQRELALRDVEGDGFQPRPAHAELSIYNERR